MTHTPARGRKFWRAFLLAPALLLAGLTTQAAETSLTMTSDSGDFIGQGQFYTYTPAEGTFSAQKNFDEGVSVSFSGVTPGEFWNLDFAAANNLPLVPGLYIGAMRFPFQESAQPGLDVSGNGRGCNMLTGSFEVIEVVYGVNDAIEAFDATFEQHCEGAIPALRGQIKFNASNTASPVNLSAPNLLAVLVNQNVNFVVSATEAQLGAVALTAMNLPAGSSFVDNGDNTGTFDWTPGTNQAGDYVLSFRGENAGGQTDTSFTLLKVSLPPPGNDDFDQASVVSGIPFSVALNPVTATVAADDPSCFGSNQTLWFAYTPTVSQRVEANTFGSTYDTTLSVYTGTRGALTQLGCSEDANGTVQSKVAFDAIAGTTYYVMASSLFPVASATLQFTLQEAPPPFSFTPAIEQFGSVKSSTGAVTVRGSVTCSSPAFVNLNGQLKQMRGQTPLTGFFGASFVCDGVTPWSAQVQVQPALNKGRSSLLFSGGEATASVSASAHDFVNGEFVVRDFVVDIKLRGTK